VDSKTEAVPSSQAPSIHPSTSAFIGLGPVFVPYKAPFAVWVESILLFILVRKLDHDRLVECISWKHPVRSHL
jgi:hypothetical protein